MGVSLDVDHQPPPRTDELHARTRRIGRGTTTTVCSELLFRLTWLRSARPGPSPRPRRTARSLLPVASSSLCKRPRQSWWAPKPSVADGGASGRPRPGCIPRRCREDLPVPGSTASSPSWITNEDYYIHGEIVVSVRKNAARTLNIMRRISGGARRAQRSPVAAAALGRVADDALDVAAVAVVVVVVVACL